MKKLWLARLIGPVILVIVLLNVDLGKIWALFSQLDIRQVMMAACAFLGLALARCERWHLVVGTLVPGYRRRSAYESCLRSIWLGLITPGRVGEFNRILDLTRDGAMSWKAAGLLVAFDLALDFGLASAVFLAAVLVAWLMRAPVVAFEHGIGISLVVGAVVILVIPPTLAVMSSLATRFAPLQAFAGAAKSFAQARWRTIAIGGLSLLGNAFYVATMIPLFASIDPSITVPNAIVMVAMSIAVGLVPITVFGLGTREAAFLLLFAGTGKPPETAVALSLMFVAAQVIGLAVTLALDMVLLASRKIEPASK